VPIAVGATLIFALATMPAFIIIEVLLPLADGFARTTQGSFEDFARDRFIIGDKGSVKEEIARYRESLGVDHFIMRCQWPGLPQEQVLSSIQRLGDIFAS
jgi:alkanesulfonate monooxygenase SsuD/methylene tetrahydromethanopterin reductase-like flavin-dependent oxidoreductase (luciferase family)